MDESAGYGCASVLESLGGGLGVSFPVGFFADEVSEEADCFGG